MTVSRRFAIAAALGVPVVLLAWEWGLGIPVFIIYNLLLAGVWVLDFFLMPPPSHLSVTRAAEEKLYYQAENTLSLTVENDSCSILFVQITDEISDRHFTVTREIPRRMLPPLLEADVSYTVIPSKRGSFSFNHVYIRYTGLIGFCVKYAKIPCPVTVKVYPNLLDIDKYRLMTQKNRLLPQGDKTVRLYGMGAEFESLRAYVEGDDYRRLNWMATARENRLIMNHYQVEKNQPVFILLDTGRPMSYAVGGYKKLDYAINAALILSDIVNRQGDNSGLLVYDAAVRAHIMPGKGAAHRNQLMETLYHVEDNRLTADYESAFRLLCERQKRRSLVFIFTDFEIWEEAEALIAHIAMLKRRHMPVVVFMKNERIQALATQPVYGRKDRILRDTANEFLLERKKIFKTLHAMRIPNVESTAERFAVSAVNQYLRFSRTI